MNEIKEKIITWLANDADYYEGLVILQKHVKVKGGLLNTISSRENAWNKGKVTYLLINELNRLRGSNEFTEANFKEKAKEVIFEFNNNEFHQNKSKEYLPVNDKTEDNDKSFTQKVKGIFGGIFDAYKDKLLPEELSDKQYKEWFYKQPEKIQELIKEKGALTRGRAKLHNECRKIKGNSGDAVALRKPKLDEIDEITTAIKDIDEIVKNFKISGEIIIPENENTNEKIDIDNLSDLDKKKRLDNLKISIRRNQNALKKKKSKNSTSAISLKNKIATKEKEIAVLQKWYDSLK